MQAPASNADRERDRPARRISVQTLLIASIASAVASFLASRLLGSGTLISAAVTPVIVALVSESLRRPVQVVADTARKLPSVPGDARDADAAPQQSAGEPVAEDASLSAATGAQSEAGGRPQWRWAVVTGLLAFVIVVAIFTVPDLLAGRSITGDGQPTTFFGGSSRSNKHESSTTTTTTTTPTATTITRPASTTKTATTSPGAATRTSETTTPTTTTGTSAGPGTGTTTSTTSATGGAAPSPAGATTPAP